MFSKVALCIGMLVSVTPGMAGQASGQFNVQIKLNQQETAPGVCISQTLSEQTSALVQVACQTGQFVSITPIPGRPFLGTHGGAFRYGFNGNNVSGGSMFNAGNPYIGAGTITALRIYNADGSDGPLEMLVSF